MAEGEGKDKFTGPCNSCGRVRWVYTFDDGKEGWCEECHERGGR
ncbi:hypothetical protein CENSYa_0029 [Cenarchaeum symbiosum A]|uniref:Uncharacterized protein n=1 Tax=Cenarchaeum symbiosum (strain A) TaxID=414004 RepID=A0RTM0_CENSY|nr:hypothetical protein CENSYa_0029 [Cenarchaeum symbiosum A]